MAIDKPPAHVLIVEDSPIQAELLRRFITKENFICTVATDGEAALLSLRTSRPDIIISDIQMPILDGYEMCERIKGDPEFHSIPVILLTALSDPVDVIRGLNAGAQAYITKPYDNERLLTQVHRLLSAPAKEDEFKESQPLEVEVNKSPYSVKASREQILQMLLSTYDNAAYQNKLLQKLEEDLHVLNNNLEQKVVARTADLTREEARARIAEDRYKTLFTLLPIGIGLLDTKSWMFVEFNDVACGQLGYLRNEFEHMSLPELSNPQEKELLLESLKHALAYPQSSFTANLLTRDGADIEVEVRTRQVEIGNEKLLNCIFRDISEINRARRVEQELEHKATHDLTTDLPGKTLLLEAIEQTIHIANHKSTPITLLAIDLGRMNTVSASLGHAAAKAIQIEMADRLRSMQPKAGIVARSESNSFMVMVDGSLDPALPTELISRITKATTLPFEWEGSSLELDPHIGVGIYPKDAKDAAGLLQTAESALYKAKESGRKAIVLASSELNEQVQNLIRKEGELRAAFANAQLEMFYQPRVNLKSGKISGAEALIRWIDPIKGIIPPSDFIHLAQDMGLITPITIWAINRVCQQQKAWLEEGVQAVPVSVNLVSEQFQDNDIITTLKAALDKHQLPAPYLEVELTESTAMQNPEMTTSLLEQIRNMGILIAIDDFGTGYSSLAYLEKFPIDILKIDISFVRRVTTDPHAIAITSAVIAMAKELNFLIVAEGVETDGQREFLSGHHCEEGQGFLFSKPVPADEFKKLLTSNIAY